MEHTRGLWWVWALSSVLVLAGCGAKTGLLIPDADHEPDAELDADPDMDAEADVDACAPAGVPIEPRLAEVMFVIDRSASMSWTLEGEMEPWPGELTRWDVLRDALRGVLHEHEHLMEVGAKFFPLEIDPYWPISNEEACTIDPGIELRPAPYNTASLLAIFDRTDPAGGTPTAPALSEARDFLVENERPGISPFIILATDGGPNCNSGLTIPCVCTGSPDFCSDPVGGIFNCLDDERTLEVVTSIFSGHGIPVFVIGIDNPTRPDLGDVLDEMALAGGRPRTEPGERLFYSIREHGQLRDALDRITSTIARCVFTVSPVYGSDPRLELSLDGSVIPRDTAQEDGWDWTDADAGELTLFGATCDRASVPGAEVTARLICIDDAG